LDESRLGVVIDLENIPDATNWCLVVGGARTGSSCFCELISKHPDAVILNEGWLWGICDALLYNICQIDKPLTTRIMPGRILHSLEEAQTSGEFGINGMWKGSFFRRLLELFRPPGLNIFGDKRHAYLLPHNQVIFSILPKCKVVVTTRNLLDRVSSFINWDWWAEEQNGNLSPQEKAIKAMREIKYQDERIRQLALTRGNNIHYVSFENMATDPVREWNKVLDYLELSRDFPKEVLCKTKYKNVCGRWKRDRVIMELVNENEDFYNAQFEQCECVV